MKRYVKQRLSEDNRNGGKVSGTTVHKELTTFEQLWQWARGEKHVICQCPTKDADNPRKRAIKLPKKAGKEPRRTWAEIEQEIELRGLDEEQAKPLWAKLILDDEQVAELLDYVKDHPRYSFMFLPFMLAARAGMRRSEIAAARCSDVRLSDGLLDIRERKRVKHQSSSTRHCVLSQSLRQCFESDGLDRVYLVTNADGHAMTPDMLSDQFVQTLKNSKWSVLGGWHTLRHSFGSICLRKGIPIHVTAKWMGHTTQEMIELYQNIYIQDEYEFAKLLD